MEKNNGAPKRAQIGLACAGGVVEGAVYEIGALCALEESIDGLELNRLDSYVGVSSGGLIAACLANGISSKTLALALVNQADEEALNLRPEVMFSFAFSEYAKRIGNIPAALQKSLEHYIKRPNEWSFWGAIGSLGMLIPTGLFDNRKIESYARSIFTTGGRTNSFKDLKARLHIVATELDSASIRCFGDDNNQNVPISKAIQASTALPGLYTPVKINGEYYIDGVARRTVHVSSLLETGTNLVFCVNPIVPVNTHMSGSLGRPIKRQLVEHGFPAVMSQTLRTLVSSRMKTGFKRYDQLYPDADLILIEPEVDDFDVFFSNIFSFSNRLRVCEHAYQTTRTFLKNNAELIQPKLTKHGLRLRTEILGNGRRTLFDGTISAEGTSLLRQAPMMMWNQFSETVTKVRESIS